MEVVQQQLQKSSKLNQYTVFSLITKHLNFRSLIKLCETNKTIYNYCQDDYIWKHIFYKDFILIKHNEKQFIKQYGSFRKFIYSKDFFDEYTNLLYPEQDTDIFQNSAFKIKNHNSKLPLFATRTFELILDSNAFIDTYLTNKIDLSGIKKYFSFILKLVNNLKNVNHNIRLTIENINEFAEDFFDNAYNDNYVKFIQNLNRNNFFNLNITKLIINISPHLVSDSLFTCYTDAFPKLTKCTSLTLVMSVYLNEMENYVFTKTSRELIDLLPVCTSLRIRPEYGLEQCSNYTLNDTEFEKITELYLLDIVIINDKLKCPQLKLLETKNIDYPLSVLSKLSKLSSLSMDSNQEIFHNNKLDLNSLPCKQLENLTLKVVNSDILDISSFTHLKTLTIEKTNIKDIIGLNKFLKLTTLNLDNNSTFPDISDLSMLKNLKTVKIVNTQNLTIDGSIIQKTIPFFLTTIPNLTTLHLNNNKLSNVDNIINLNHNLIELILSRNFIVTLPKSIDKLQKLEYLYLDYNKLQVLPESIGYLKNLKYLALNHNKLTSLPMSIIRLDARIAIYKNTPTLKQTLIDYANNTIEIQYNFNNTSPEYIKFLKN